MFLHILFFLTCHNTLVIGLDIKKTHLISSYSCFGLKLLFSLQQSLSEVSLKNMDSVATHMAADGPKSGLHKLLKNGRRSL